MNSIDGRIHELSRNQVHDPDRGSFYVGLTVSKHKDRIERFRGRTVYVDSYGRKLTIKETE
jgi:hypothetical protein